MPTPIIRSLYSEEFDPLFWHGKCSRRSLMMQDIALEEFPLRLELKDGTPCSIRPMETGDDGAFRDFHSVIPEREQLFIRAKIKDGSLFREWMEEPGHDEHVVLLAHIDGKLVGMGSLHLRPGGWKRHIGRVYFLTHPHYRGLGLIDEILGQIVSVAEHLGLTRLESELNGERESAIAAMAAAGFVELARLPDYIQDMKAEYHDYVLMGLNLVADYENLGAGD